jgi:hypothetical protein
MGKAVFIFVLFAFSFVGHAQTHLASALMPPHVAVNRPSPLVPLAKSPAITQLTPLQELCKAQHDLGTNLLAVVETDTNDFLVASNGISVLHPGQILAIGSFEGITAMAVASGNEMETVQGSSNLLNWSGLYSISNQFPFFIYIDFAAQPQQFFRTAHSQSILLSSSTVITKPLNASKIRLFQISH